MSILTLMAIAPGANSIPNLLAGSEDLGSWAPTQIFSGESDIVTDGGEVGVAFAKYQVIAIPTSGTNLGKLVPWDPAATDGSEFAAGIANEAGVVGSNAPFYTGGVFNPDALVWPAAVTTLAAKKAAFQRTNIQITVLY
jgi:hypothetical protein